MKRGREVKREKKEFRKKRSWGQKPGKKWGR